MNKYINKICRQENIKKNTYITEVVSWYMCFCYNIQYILDTVYMRHLVDYLPIYSYSKYIRDY